MENSNGKKLPVELADKKLEQLQTKLTSAESEFAKHHLPDKGMEPEKVKARAIYYEKKRDVSRLEHQIKYRRKVLETIPQLESPTWLYFLDVRDKPWDVQYCVGEDELLEALNESLESCYNDGEHKYQPELKCLLISRVWLYWEEYDCVTQVGERPDGMLDRFDDDFVYSDLCYDLFSAE